MQAKNLKGLKTFRLRGLRGSKVTIKGSDQKLDSYRTETDQKMRKRKHDMARTCDLRTEELDD